jgi:hypothetical protein
LKPLEATNVISLIPNREDAQYMQLAAMNDTDGVVLAITKGRTGVRLYWIDLADLAAAKVVAKSAVLPLAAGKYRLCRDANGGLLFSCLETKIVSSHEKPTGTLLRFGRRGDNVIAIDSMRYDPQLEIALWDEKGVLNITPVVHFNYLSSFDLANRVLMWLPGAALKEYDSHKSQTRVFLDEFKNSETERKADKLYQKLDISK